MLRRKWIRFGVVAATLALVVPTAVSYEDALTGPGTDALSVRSVEWLRTHHFRWLVDDVENFWYGHHQPKKGGAPSAALQAQLRAPASTAPTAPAPPTIAHLAAPMPIQPFVSDPMYGEGQWSALGEPVHGIPAMYATYLRPDAVHTSLVAAVAWIDPKLVKAVGYAGAVEPGGSGWAHQLPIPGDLRSNLLAAFNSGFKMQDSLGGYYDAGRYARPLRTGAATMWITADGTLHVGKWGRDATLTSDVVFARQNLDLIVDQGQPVPSFFAGSSAQWGFTLGGKIMVWRSAIGERPDGALVYVAGPGLSARMLADLLVRAGALDAMELDINSAWVDYFTYFPPTAGMSPGSLTVKKLLVDMAPSTSNYLVASSRDCVALFSR